MEPFDEDLDKQTKKKNQTLTLKIEKVVHLLPNKQILRQLWGTMLWENIG